MKHVTRNPAPDTSCRYGAGTKQEGVTLLLAMLIMASIALVSLSVGAFAIQELRASRAVALTEPAISAAETAGEQSLWLTKRFEPSDPTYQLVNCNSGVTNSALSNNTRVNACKSYNMATFKLEAGTDFVFFLYDPNDVNGDYDLQGCLTCIPPSTNPSGFPYSWLTVTNKSASYQVTATINRIDFNNTLIGSDTIGPSITKQIGISLAPAGSESRMMVTLNATGDTIVEVDTDQGMPTFPTLDVLGCSSRSPISDCNNPAQEAYMRRINISLPEE